MNIFIFEWMTHVHVHPELVLLTDIRYEVQWVKRTSHRGSTCAAYQEWHCTLGDKTIMNKPFMHCFLSESYATTG